MNSRKKRLWGGAVGFVCAVLFGALMAACSAPSVSPSGASPEIEAIQIHKIAEYDPLISPLEENSLLLTATVKNAEESETLIDWSIAWEKSTGWVEENIIDTYLRLSPTEDGAATATLTMVREGFQSPAIVTASLRDNPGKTAKCTVHYLRRPTYDFYTYGTGEAELGQDGLRIGSETLLGNHSNTGVDGTVDGSYKIVSASLQLSDVYLWLSRIIDISKQD